MTVLQRIYRCLIAAIITMPLSLVHAEALLFGSPEKGEQWHTEKCGGCHAARFDDGGNVIYTRENRRVKSIEGLMQQVQFCNANTAAGLSVEQLDDITAYLNQQFYQFEGQ